MLPFEEEKCFDQPVKPFFMRQPTDTYDDSISDYGDFLRNNKRYQSMINANSLDEQIAALGVSGYATDPDYAEKIESIAKSKRLEDFA